MRDMYLTSKEKIDLSVEVAKRERELLSHIDYETGYSLYVGIPFCPTITRPNPAAAAMRRMT